MAMYSSQNFNSLMVLTVGLSVLFVKKSEAASTDIELDAKAQQLHRIDSLNLLLYTFLLTLTVLTIWLFKHRRLRFLHETGLAVIYGLIIGALIRYTGTSNSVTHMAVIAQNNTKYNLTVPPDTLWFKFPYKRVNSSAILNKTYSYTFRGEIVDVENSEIDLKATFDPEIFFNIILPPIIFHAGYSLKRRYFFRNLGAILTYAIIGTTISSFVVGLLMYGLIQIMPHLKTSFTFLDTLYFGALISSTDPLTILAIFNDLHVDVNLYALVFGESVLNDAVSIVLSGAIQNYGKIYQSNESEFETYAFFRAFGDFIGIFSLSLIIGALMGCITALNIYLTKYTRVRDFPLLESALFVLMSYSTFLIAEVADLTGIVAVLFCGICQAHYTYNNLSDNSRTRTKHLFQLLNFLAENFIFCYIGVSMFTFPKHRFDPFFIFSGFVCATLGRAANIYPLSFLLNLGRKPKISTNFQHMLFFAGLRGAMSFALAIRNTLSEARQAMLTTTSLIVIATVIIQGGATMQLLTWFNIPVGVEEEMEVFPYAGVRNVYNSTGTHSGDVAESSSPNNSGKQISEKALLARIWGDFDTKYMKPFLTDSRPTLLETLPVCCNPLARFLTTTTQMTQDVRSRSRHDSDSDICLEENSVRRNSISVPKNFLITSVPLPKLFWAAATRHPGVVVFARTRVSPLPGCRSTHWSRLGQITRREESGGKSSLFFPKKKVDDASIPLSSRPATLPGGWLIFSNNGRRERRPSEIGRLLVSREIGDFRRPDDGDIMVLGKRHSISTFVIKFLWILFLVFQDCKLVICGGSEDDSLKKALETIERRQRDLEFQENEYYGQPENIGYGFQKTLGFFDSTGPATELGSFDSGPQSADDFRNLLNYGSYVKDDPDYDNGFEKRKSNFRERMSNPKKTYLIDQRNDSEDDSQSGTEYFQLLKNLWLKYRQSRPDDVTLEDLTDEQVEEILNSLYEKGGPEEGYGKAHAEPNGYGPLDLIPVRIRKNYRVFDRFGDRKKRYPSFGEGIYGKRNLHSQNINYESPSENDFLYSLKYVNPEINGGAVENLREEGFEVLGDEKDKDIMNILNEAMNRAKYFEEDEPYWSKDRNNYEEEEAWLSGPVTFSNEGYDEYGRNEKRRELVPRYFKNHEGIHLNGKRFPVKRSSIRVRKEAKNEKVSKELKGIFATQETTTVLPKKSVTKKPIEMVKKQNATKPEVTKHHDTKKVVRRANKYTKEVLPMSKNEEIVDIFAEDKKSKKSIDWSQYFGLDKRSGESWLNADYLKTEEGHFVGPKNKRYSDRGNVDFPTVSRYEIPFDTRIFSRKRYSSDLGANIDKVENRIGDIEEKIIDDAVKYTGAHSGGAKGDLNQVKSKVIQRLEAAYSLEKMKNALEEFKNLIKPGRNSEPARKPATEVPKTETRTTGPKESPNLEKPLSEKKPLGEANKRVATKKESVKGLFNQEPADGLEFLNDVYGNKQYDNDACPVLDKILHNCLRVEEMGGKFAELLVPLCSLQQICYFCGAETGFARTSTCDAMYLTEAQNICQGDSDCLVNARNSMLALQDLYEQDLLNENGRRLLSGSCLANPCVQSYFLNAPGAIYPLEIQK